MRRRTALKLAAAGLMTAAAPSWAREDAVIPGDLPAQLRRIEAESGGRLGVALLDGATGQLSGYRGDERFPMCSTFKFLLAAAVLRRVDAGAETLQRQVPIRAQDLVSHSPVCERHVGAKGLRVGELCEATLTWSDNAAANLLLPSIGGPEGLTMYARSLDDEATRLDRNEPSLNSAIPGDPRDTTTPVAMAGNLHRILLGEALSPGSRGQLELWMRGNRTGDARLRAGLPHGWAIADKTGAGANGSNNHIAVIWPPRRAPVALACYLTGASLPASDPILKSVAQAVVSDLHRAGAM